MKFNAPQTDSHESPESISARLQQIIGYDFKNPRLVEFLDRNADSHQLASLERTASTPDVIRRVADRFRQVEAMFTEPVARAADIVQLRIRRENPTMKWVNLDLVVPRAIEIVEEETAERLDVHADIWYPARKKR